MRRTARPTALEQLVLALAIASLAGCGNSVAPGPAAQGAPSVPTASALGPQLGYLWMPSSQTLLPILGIAGASQIGQSVVPAGTYINAAASATANLAVLQASDGSLYLMALPTGSPISLGVNLPAGAKIRLSPLATAALVFTPGASSASLITGLPSAARVQTVAAPAAIADAAVSDSGAVSLESTHSISVTALNGTAVTLAIIGAPGGISFIPGTTHDDLLFADSASNTLTLIRSTTSGPSSQTISATGLLQSPSAVGVSGSGRWALVINSGSQSAVRVNLSSLATTAIACACQPTLAEPLADDGAFRVTSLATGPNWLMKAASATPNTLFIPAVPTPVSTANVSSTVRP
jgi:hypothetical protein